MKHIANKIRYFRTQKDWTQYELAKQLSVSRSVVAKWETSHAMPDALSIKKLCKIFGISSDFLLGCENSYTSLLENASSVQQFELNEELSEELIKIIEFILFNPKFKNSLLHLNKLSLTKQEAVLQILTSVINEMKEL